MIRVVERSQSILILQLRAELCQWAVTQGCQKQKWKLLCFLEKASMIVLLEAQDAFRQCSDHEIGPWAEVGTALAP